MKFSRQSGVALVITLIMLSVITVMAVAFLALSRRERASVVHSQASIDAELMASTGLERAKAEILARIIGQVVTSNIPTNIIVPTNLFGPDLFVSGSTTTTNPVPFIYDDPINGPNQAAARQWIWSLVNGSPPPVFVKTNSAGIPRENRWFLDLNRNGAFEPSGLLPITDAAGNLTNALFTGDPQWFGVLSRPTGLNHTNNNRFIGRYAYIVLPVGHSLDLNFIHNQAKDLSPTMAGGVVDGFFRNQGVGSWEINLAAFLADLNA
ncbi:MAG TPA: hypothetical protein VKM56_11640, partial [Verrucomicrobiae bacterium]|nr:hypothetical protein [Verrucomicrobiae bacterium]